MRLEPKPLKPSFQRSPKRARGPTAPEIQSDDTESPDDPGVLRDDAQGEPQGLTDEQRAEIQRRRDVLEATVSDRIREAIFGRKNSGIEEVWSESDDLYNGVDERNAPANNVKTRDQARSDVAATSRSKVVLNITKPKTDTGVARVQEMLVPTDDKPWAVEPTPIPEIDEQAKRGLEQMASQSQQAQQQVQLADGSTAPAALVAKYVKEKSAEAAEAESTWIEDRLIEGKVYSHMRDVIKDAGRLGTGVLKGPVPVEYTDRRWSVQGRQAVLEIVKRIDPTSKRVPVDRCFPDPACGSDIQKGEYFCEQDFLTTRQLRDLAGLDGYDREAIARAVIEGPIPAAMTRSDRALRQQQGDSVNEAGLYEVYYYYGWMRPEDLIILGAPGEEFDETDLALVAIPCVCTILNGRCIKATISPLESGEFPYSFFRWDTVDGQPWGRGIPWKMRTAQKGVTAAVRALLENAGMSSGPQIAFIKGALVPVNGRYEVVGRKLWEFDPDDKIDDIRKAFATFNIPSVQNELLELVQFWLNMADQLTNLPMLLQGEQAAGTSPETLGGMKMLMNNATSPLRVVAKGYDDDVINTMFPRYHDWYMAYVDAPLKKFCDTRIKARGSTVLVQREEAREFLTGLYPVMNDPNLRIDPAKYIDQLARANGFSMSNIQYTEDEWAKKQQEMAQNQPPKDPRIEAAEIRNQGMLQQQQMRSQDMAQDREFKSQQAEAQRQTDALMAHVQMQIEQMRLAGQKDISLDQVKGMLAKSAGDLNIKRQEMQLKLMPANPTHQGI